jgi:hypothetical protein
MAPASPWLRAMEVERFTGRFAALGKRLEEIEELQGTLAGLVEREPAVTLGAITPMIELARRVIGAPALMVRRSGRRRGPRIARQSARWWPVGERHAALRAELAGTFTDTAWTTDTTDDRELLGRLPLNFSLEAFACLANIGRDASAPPCGSGALARSMGLQAPTTFAESPRLLRVGERVAPRRTRALRRLRPTSGDSGVDRAADLAEAVRTLEMTRAEIGSTLSDAAGRMDLSTARATLASHGTGLFKILSGEWRKANRLVRSILTNPDQPLDATLTQLDALARGQAARRTIEREDGFGRAVFGTDWRADRAGSAPLIVLVEWMRSLKGLGAERGLWRRIGPIAMQSSHAALEPTRC